MWYVNRRGRVKGVSEVVVRWRNGGEIVESLGEDEKVMLGGDKKLGN